jgi:large subunit ribosomal protein L10
LSLSLQDKQAVVAELSAELGKAQSVVVAEYRGMAVGAMTELRRKARAEGVYLKVLKNTLARRAVGETPFKGLTDHLVGPLAYGISADPVAAAKVLDEFAKVNDKLVIRAGALPNQLLSAREVQGLARLPSRNELLSMLMGTMQAPVAKFVQTLNEVPARFVRTVAAVRDQKQGADAPA